MKLQRSTQRLNANNRRRLLQGVDARRAPEQDLSLQARLEALAERVHPSNIDELWVFPPLPNRETASEFILVTGFEAGSDGHRHVITAHVEAEFVDEEGTEFCWVQRIEEVGPVPCEWLRSLPDSLLGRLAEAGVPEVVEIGGKLEAWEAVVSRFGGKVEAGNGNGSGAASFGGGSGAVSTVRTRITLTPDRSPE